MTDMPTGDAATTPSLMLRETAEAPDVVARLLDANARLGRYELDLVLRRGRRLLVVEVKEKGGLDYGDPLEMIDPETGLALEMDDGANGELVLTHLRHRAAPLLRFRTRDHVVVRTSALTVSSDGVTAARAAATSASISSMSRPARARSTSSLSAKYW